LASKLGVYHSKFPDAERVEIWQKQLSNEPYDVILGVRSSVFFAVQQVGTGPLSTRSMKIRIKQQDPAPRNHARNAAIVLASMLVPKPAGHGNAVSIESYFNAQTGKYGLVEIKERFQEIQLPEIVPVDIKE
jgi:primosomal protein N' (replication factor Y)